MFREWTRRVYPFSVSSLTIEGKEEAGEEGKKSFARIRLFFLNPPPPPRAREPPSSKSRPPAHCSARASPSSNSLSPAYCSARAHAPIPPPIGPGARAERACAWREKKNSAQCVRAIASPRTQGAQGFPGKSICSSAAKRERNITRLWAVKLVQID